MDDGADARLLGVGYDGVGTSESRGEDLAVGARCYVFYEGVVGELDYGFDVVNGQAEALSSSARLVKMVYGSIVGRFDDER